MISVFIRFECGQEGRMSEVFGPYEFVQATYASIRVGPDGDRFIAHFEEGWWVTEDGQRWSDFIVCTDQ